MFVFLFQLRTAKGRRHIVASSAVTSSFGWECKWSFKTTSSGKPSCLISVWMKPLTSFASCTLCPKYSSLTRQDEANRAFLVAQRWGSPIHSKCHPQAVGCTCRSHICPFLLALELPSKARAAGLSPMCPWGLKRQQATCHSGEGQGEPKNLVGESICGHIPGIREAV